METIRITNDLRMNTYGVEFHGANIQAERYIIFRDDWTIRGRRRNGHQIQCVDAYNHVFATLPVSCRVIKRVLAAAKRLGPKFGDCYGQFEGPLPQSRGLLAY